MKTFSTRSGRSGRRPSPLSPHPAVMLPWMIAASFAVIACGTRSELDDWSRVTACGPGGDSCLPPTPPLRDVDAGAPPLDAGRAPSLDSSAADGAAQDSGGNVWVPPEAGPASCFAVDPAHDNTVPDASIASPLTPAWTTTFGGNVTFPVLAGERVIIAANETPPDVQAFDLTSGARLWGPIVFGSLPLLATEGETIFALENAGTLSALAASDGHRLWSVQLPGEAAYWNVPVAAGGLVYAMGAGEGGGTSAVDEVSGATVWNYPTAGGNVAIAGNVAYEDDGCQATYAFDILAGKVDWFHRGTCSGTSDSVPSLYGGLVWVFDRITFGGTDGLILDSSGNPQGTFSTNSPPALHANTAFYLTTTLTAVDISSQTVKWTFAGDGSLCTSPVVAGAGAQVFVGSSSGNLYELDETTGAQRSVSNVGMGQLCNSELETALTALGLAPSHLLVPTYNELFVY